MSQNAADLLHQFFTSPDRSNFKFAALWAAMVDIESNIDAWERMGQNVTPFRTAVDVFKTELNASVDQNFRCVNPAAGYMSSGDLGVLNWISEKLSHTTPTFTEDDIFSIRDIVREAGRAVVGDTSLPDDLRLHLARLIRQVEDCLDNWEITGDFVLADALDRLMGAMRIAETKSSNPTAWTDLWDKWVQPIAVGLISSMPQVGLQVAQMLTAGS